MKIVFFGTPDFAAIVLQALVDSGHHISAVVTQPDRPAGRGKHVQASSVKQIALAHNIAVLQPPHFKDEQAITELKQYAADIYVVVAYGCILPVAVLAVPLLGALNVHASLLPRWRGASPIQHAILAGDSETGVGIMQMEASLDTGPILLEKTCQVRHQTAIELSQALAQLGANALLELFNRPPDSWQPKVQSTEGVCYAHKINKQDALIDWHQSAIEIERKVRAFAGWPVTYTDCQQQPVKIIAASVVDGTTDAPAGQIIDNHGRLWVATGSGILSIAKMQFPGKKPLDIDALLNSKREALAVGVQLG